MKVGAGGCISSYSSPTLLLYFSASLVTIVADNSGHIVAISVLCYTWKELFCEWTHAVYPQPMSFGCQWDGQTWNGGGGGGGKCHGMLLWRESWLLCNISPVKANLDRRRRHPWPPWHLHSRLSLAWPSAGYNAVAVGIVTSMEWTEDMKTAAKYRAKRSEWDPYRVGCVTISHEPTVEHRFVSKNYWHVVCTWIGSEEKNIDSMNHLFVFVS